MNGNNSFAAQQNEAKRALLFALFVGLPFHAQAAKFLTVTEDHVHVLIESHELADKHAPVVNGDAHAVIDVLHDLAVLGHAAAHGCHLGGVGAGSLDLKNKRDTGGMKGGKKVRERLVGIRAALNSLIVCRRIAVFCAALPVRTLTGVGLLPPCLGAEKRHACEPSVICDLLKRVQCFATSSTRRRRRAANCGCMTTPSREEPVSMTWLLAVGGDGGRGVVFERWGGFGTGRWFGIDGRCGSVCGEKTSTFRVCEEFLFVGVGVSVSVGVLDADDAEIDCGMLVCEGACDAPLASQIEHQAKEEEEEETEQRDSSHSTQKMLHTSLKCLNRFSLSCIEKM